MRKKLSYLSTVIVASVMATTANAATIVIDTSVPAGGFTNDNVTCLTTTPCKFSDSGTFVTPTGFGLVTLTISTAVAGMNNLTNIDFSSVLFNGVAFALSPNGDVEFGSLSNQVLALNGTNTLVVNGTTGGNASYRGTLSFAQAAAVPEPAAWMLMLLGMAGIGFSMRRKDKQTLRVRYT
ncbi:FxDxF family PEP-CTERM protein [Sphingorhabdus sp.]|uniref:FxDxF family PEP-CTERM protein n=1 Tax=Sphingorhabdus sp. TaxID=1902408 RepID=UPI003983B7F8